MNSSRQPKGVPIGGQFAANGHDEAPSGLSSSRDVSASDIRAGDTVDMTPLVESYVANSFDGVIDGEDDGQDMLGEFTVTSAETSGNLTTLKVQSASRSYDWYVTPETSVPLVRRGAPEISDVAGLASFAGAPKTKQPMIGYSPDPDSVQVSAPATGSGMTFEIEAKTGGSLTLYPKDLGSLDADQSYDRVTVRNVDGRMVAEGEISAGNVADAKDARHMDANRERVEQYLQPFGMRLPPQVKDWSKVTLVTEHDLSSSQYTGDEGRKGVYTDDINDSVNDRNREQLRWVREGRFAQGMRQAAGLPLRP